MIFRNLFSSWFWLPLAATVVALGLLFIGGEALRWSELADPLSASSRILWELRLPRLLLALSVGGILACVGATYQALFRNPLADPYLLGISSAVTLGAILAELALGAAPLSFWSIVFSTVTSILSTILILRIYRRGTQSDINRVVLFGMGLNFVLSSTVFLILSYRSQQMGGGSLRWIFGQVPWPTLETGITWFLALVAGWLILLSRARWLDALSLGDLVATTLGIAPRQSRLILLVLTSLFVAFTVMATGAVGFIGLVTPHALRVLLRPRSQRLLLWLCFPAGGLFLALSDSLSRVLLPPFEFPIGVVTTLLGGPLFLWLLWRRA